MSFTEELSRIVGAENVLQEEHKLSYLVDKHHRLIGNAISVVKPKSTEEVAAIVRLCNKHKIKITPQGGNTGFVGAAIPDDSERNIVLSLGRMNTIRAIDLENDTITVDAGCLLHEVHEQAFEHQRLFPLSFGAEKHCSIGGNLATNAGGSKVIRYGSARELTLGIEVVTADGEIWSNLKGLRKDNSGYDLRDLYIGSEGTLGIITAAVLKLYPVPQAQKVAFLLFDTIKNAVTFLADIKPKLGAGLTAYELISANNLELVRKNRLVDELPFSDPKNEANWYVLLEFSDHENERHADDLIKTVIDAGINSGIVKSALVAKNKQQAKLFWRIRNIEINKAHQISERYLVRHDISLPVSQITQFIAITEQKLRKAYPHTASLIYGHLADGNLHYDVALRFSTTDAEFKIEQARITKIVHDGVRSLGGSICAEYGVGQIKVDQLLFYKTQIELDLMRRLKRAFDPQGILNPGKIIPANNASDDENLQIVKVLGATN